ncbi:DUF6227 family protein [Streptomyces apocyni]|uniref:DUF6227 family protein n=1 Tax=Streptomyces apocyni TaxID=2654677 RepID=UPI0012E9D657|nr:DUF6227 family protein [Streptomyces apocyni]
MSVPYQTPEEHLHTLLGRALNSFELPDETIRRLDSALAYDSSLYSAHHSGGLHRETHRHTFLLADGSALTLWELAHNSARGSQPQHELFADEEEVRTAASRLPFAGGPDPFDEAAPGGGAGGGAGGDALPPEILRLVAEYAALPKREYITEGSADHARRLLRRAENADRPGERTARRVSTALAHQIIQAFRSPCSDASGFGFALYEHAFLLHDGSEVSLWEAEHTATPDGRHMCEVYLSQDAALAAMERRAGQPS